MEPGGAAAAQPGPEAGAPRRRMRRSERREQILAAATRAFARTGFAATSLDDVAREAGVSKVILYRHFESKTDLYRAALDGICTRLVSRIGADDFTRDSVDELVRAAADDPDGFRLLFHHAAREPEFRDEMDQFRAGMVELAHRHLDTAIPDPSWARWAAQLNPVVAIEAVIAWLDAGQPDPDTAAARVHRAIDGVNEAARDASLDSRETDSAFAQDRMRTR